MPSSSKTPLIKNKFLIIILIGAAIYLFLGPLGLIAASTAIASKKIFDNRQLNKFVRQAIDNGNIDALTKLQEHQIELTYQQKVDMLINGYVARNTTVIEYLSEQNFKINFSILYTIFSQEKDLVLLKILIDKFTNRNSTPQTENLNSMLRYFCTSNAYDLVESLLMIYPNSVFPELFSLIENRVDENQLLLFIEKKKEWLSTNIQLVNSAMRNCSDNHLLGKLITIFHGGELRVCGNILKLIDDKITDKSLFTNLIDYISKSEKNEQFISDLEDIIYKALFQKKLDLAEQIFINHPDLLSTQKAISNRLLFRYSESPHILELLLKYGADVNSTDKNGVTLLESKIGSKYKPIREKQELFDIFLKYRADLHCRVQDTPKQIEMTLLGYLPFLNLKVINNKEFDAIRLQKFLAMFLEIPGTSRSNGTLCKHSYMQDSHAYLNFILDLYFQLKKNKVSSQPPFIEKFNLYLKTLYSENGEYNSEALYEAYKQGKPIAIPVNIRDDFGGGSHIATLGLMKIGPNSHLIIEADRGFGRHDFSVFNDICFSYPEFCQYIRTIHAPIYSSKWQYHKTKAIFSKDIGKQKDDFCPAISAKYTFNIAYFLHFISHELSIIDHKLTNNVLPELIFRSYEESRYWFNEFSVEIPALMLETYKALELKYIDPDFLATAKKIIEKIVDLDEDWAFGKRA